MKPDTPGIRPSHVNIAQAARMAGASYASMWNRVQDRNAGVIIAGCPMVPIEFVDEYIAERKERGRRLMEAGYERP